MWDPRNGPLCKHVHHISHQHLLLVSRIQYVNMSTTVYVLALILEWRVFCIFFSQNSVDTLGGSTFTLTHTHLPLSLRVTQCE